MPLKGYKDLHYLSESNFTILNNSLTEAGKLLYASIIKIKEPNVRKGTMIDSFFTSPSLYFPQPSHLALKSFLRRCA
jgi:hypothetical protein